MRIVRLSSRLAIFSLCAIAPILSGVALGAAAEPSAPVRVELRHTDSQWELLRAGKPYFIKGGGGNRLLKTLAASGGNSLRTWGVDNLEKTLDEAQSLGLTVTVGIWLGQVRQGFDYTDAKQVEDQLQRARQAIERYKNHPAVLLWGIGNEMETGGGDDNAAMWMAVNDIAALAHKLDPNHPTMTVIAEIGGKKLQHIERLCPEIDIVGVNSYGGIASLPKRYKAAGVSKPYVVTEFGPPGTWETSENAFGVAPELTSTEKAARYREAWQKAVAEQKGLALGGYAFVWGNKQESTATWFGLFLPDGTRLGAVDALTELWSGKPPENRCPEIKSLKLSGADQVEPGAAVHAALEASDPDSDKLKVVWTLQSESASFGQGGDAEDVPPTFPAAIVKADEKSAELKMPTDGGPYRLFATVYDNHGGAAVANVPLLVKGPVAARKAKVATLPLVVYDEADRASLPFAPTGWMGDAKSIKLDPACEVKPHAGKTCMRAEFANKQGWGGVVWQSPANDWGTKPGGWSLQGAKRLMFWARGEKGSETVTFEFGLIPRDKPFFDTSSGKLDKVKLTAEWKEYSIDLGGKDLSRVKTGFVWTLASPGEPVVFYLDDIRYE